MQKSQLQDDLYLAEQTAAHLKAEEASLRDELSAQMMLLNEFEQRFEKQVEESQKQVDALRLQLAQSRTGNGLLVGSNSVDNDNSIDEQLAEADKTVKILAAEKIQLLEAYEALELDTGRLIDDAVKDHRDQVNALKQQIQVWQRDP